MTSTARNIEGLEWRTKGSSGPRRPKVCDGGGGGHGDDGGRKFQIQVRRLTQGTECQTKVRCTGTGVEGRTRDRVRAGQLVLGL
jgi:hypothetical protein